MANSYTVVHSDLSLHVNGILCDAVCDHRNKLIKISAHVPPERWRDVEEDARTWIRCRRLGLPVQSITLEDLNQLPAHRPPSNRELFRRRDLL